MHINAETAPTFLSPLGDDNYNFESCDPMIVEGKHLFLQLFRPILCLIAHLQRGNKQTLHILRGVVNGGEFVLFFLFFSFFSFWGIFLFSFVFFFFFWVDFNCQIYCLKWRGNMDARKRSIDLLNDERQLDSGQLQSNQLSENVTPTDCVLINQMLPSPCVRKVPSENVTE